MVDESLRGLDVNRGLGDYRKDSLFQAVAIEGRGEPVMRLGSLAMKEYYDHQMNQLKAPPRLRSLRKLR